MFADFNVNMTQYENYLLEAATTQALAVLTEWESRKVPVTCSLFGQDLHLLASVTGELILTKNRVAVVGPGDWPSWLAMDIPLLTDEGDVVENWGGELGIHVNRDGTRLLIRLTSEIQTEIPEEDPAENDLDLEPCLLPVQ